MSIGAQLTLEQSAAHLSGIVGQEHTNVCEETISAAPADTKQIAEILRFANANGLTVTPTGSGTKLGWGNPVAAEIRLSLERMNALREHAWQDMTCTVEAGCTWAALQDDLRRYGQMVGLDPLWPEQATVGGVIAANDSGAMRLKHGGLRDLIIGMTIVLADGTIAKSGGKVVKNVAGYDLHKLITGSFGTLGVIAAVNFRLHPAEEHARTWTAVAHDASVFEGPLRVLMDSQMTPSRVQLRASRQECAVDVRIAALPECMDEYGARIAEIFGQIGVEQSDETFWRARQALFDKNDSIVLKVSMLRGEIASVCQELQQWAAEEGAEIRSVAQANGLTTVALDSATDVTIALVQRLRARLRASGGSVVALCVPDVLRGNIDVWDSNSSALPLMREIKRRFDPNRILNPGRFVGSI